MRGLRGDLAGQADGAVAGAGCCRCLPRDGSGAFCVLERLEGGGVVEVEEDVALLDVWGYAER